MIPSARSLLSRDKRLPLNTWNQSGLQENVIGNQVSTFDSPRDHPQRIQSDDVSRNREAAPQPGRTKTIHTSEDRQNQGTDPMPTFPSVDILEKLDKSRIRESAQLKTVLELYDMEIHQKISVPNYQKSKSMVKGV